MQVCVSVTKLLLFRLVVTEAGRNPTLAHLELSFQHGYVPRDTTEVNMTPPMKEQRKESTWKQNQRSVRHAKTEPAEVVVDSCTAAKCSSNCDAVTLPHRIELRTRSTLTTFFQRLNARVKPHKNRARALFDTF